MQMRQLALLGLLAGFSSGCVAVVPYTANQNKVEELGVEAADTRFAEVLTQSTNPRYNAATVEDDFFQCEVQQVAMGAFYQTHTYTTTLQIYFNNISKVEVYENNVVYIRGLANEVSLKATFPSQQTAFEFADLVMSFKAQRSKS